MSLEQEIDDIEFEKREHEQFIAGQDYAIKKGWKYTKFKDYIKQHLRENPYVEDDYEDFYCAFCIALHTGFKTSAYEWCSFHFESNWNKKGIKE